MWDNPTLFHRARSIEKKMFKKKLTESIEKSFLIDPLTINNAIHQMTY